VDKAIESKRIQPLTRARSNSRTHSEFAQKDPLRCQRVQAPMNDIQHFRGAALRGHILVISPEIKVGLLEFTAKQSQSECHTNWLT
jgi:hypothetical protein